MNKKETQQLLDSLLFNQTILNDPKLLQECIDRGADIHAKNAYNETPLLFGLSLFYEYDGIHPSLKLLLEHGADINAKNNYNSNALLLLVDRISYDTKMQTLFRFFIEQGADPFCKNSHQETLLHNVNIELIDDLIALGLDVNAQTDSGYTPIMYGRDNNIERAKKLIAAGADIHATNKENENALHIYAYEPETFEYFLDLGVNPFDISKQNESGFQRFIECNNYQSTEEREVIVKRVLNKLFNLLDAQQKKSKTIGKKISQAQA